MEFTNSSRNSEWNFDKFFEFVVARSFRTDSNYAATDGVCEQNTLTRHIFSCFSALITVSHVTLAQGVVRVMSSMFHALVRLISLRLSILHSSQSLSSSTSSS